MSDDAAMLLAEAEEQIEAWLCELDAEWHGILEDARAQAGAMVAAAMSDAAELLVAAEAQAAAILATAEREAAAVREGAARDADGDEPGRVDADDLAALASAVEQLRVELSRVVEAAFDALPAVEATAAALRTVDTDDAAAASAPRRRRGLFRRLTRSRA
jgi:hypothetical protein